uniref:Large ribosomal subunit protein uL29c n=1 Tax=Caulacanthus okamurae TaxID=152008 RepID=A0A6H1U882_9FLOR|nr:50S ribosomal protein L29 [Caulacanthus okamurae]QIZ74656.1 50S ribosomal protein L29 [Caulacanthus okamurae]
MTLRKIKSIQELNIQEIDKNIIQTQREILELKIKKSTRQSIKNHTFKHKRRELAQLLTLKTQKYKL